MPFKSIELPILFILVSAIIVLIFVIVVFLITNSKARQYSRQNIAFHRIENYYPKKRLLFWVLMNSLGLAGTYKIFDYLVLNPRKIDISLDDKSYMLIGVIMLTVIFIEQIFKESKNYYIASIETIRPGKQA